MSLDSLSAMIKEAIDKYGNLPVKIIDNGMIYDIAAIVVDFGNGNQLPIAYVVDETGRKFMETPL